MFGDTINVLHNAMNLRVQKQQVISSNIANSDTPGYAPARLNFEEQLQNSISDSQVSLSSSDPEHFPIHDEAPGVQGSVSREPSLSRIGQGLFWATLVAVPVGILVGSLPVMQKITSFPFQLLRMVSPLAWMPIAVLAFETWNGAIVFLAALLGVVAAGNASVENPAVAFFGVVGLGTARLVNSHNRQVVIFTLEQGGNLNVFRQIEIAQVKHLVHLDCGHVYFDELGQILRQTDHFYFVDLVVCHTALELDSRCAVFVDEVQRNVDVDLVILVDAQEVSVGQDRLVRVTLQILQDDAFFLAVQFNGQNVGEEGFIFPSLFQFVVPDCDSCRVFSATIDDGRNFTLLTTQAAARTSPLIAPSECFNNKFLGHDMYLINT